MKNGQPQRSDDRLFMQLLAFGGCADARRSPTALAARGRHRRALRGPERSARRRAPDVRARIPAFFLDRVRPLLNEPPFCVAGRRSPSTRCSAAPTRSATSRTCTKSLLDRPRRTVLNPAWRWAVWYPLRRSGRFAQLPPEEQRVILAEHGTIGMSFGAGDYAHDIRLACHGLDKDDNDFVIGLIGKELFPLSAIVQTMRKTQQTSLYLERLGPVLRRPGGLAEP